MAKLVSPGRYRIAVSVGVWEVGDRTMVLRIKLPRAALHVLPACTISKDKTSGARQDLLEYTDQSKKLVSMKGYGKMFMAILISTFNWRTIVLLKMKMHHRGVEHSF